MPYTIETEVVSKNIKTKFVSTTVFLQISKIFLNFINMLKKLTLVALVMGAALCRANAQSALPVDATDCSNIFFKALLDEDSKSLENILASDFAVTSFDGQSVDRGTLVDAVAQGYLSVESGMLSGTNTRNYGDVGVVRGSWNAKGQVQNNSFNNELSYTVVCVKAGGSWKVSVVQFTPVR